MTIEERINEVRIRLNNPAAQVYKILRDLCQSAYDMGWDDGTNNAKENVADWITAEKVDELYQEQK